MHKFYRQLLKQTINITVVVFFFVFSNPQLCRSDLQQSTAVQVSSSAIHSCAGQIFSNPQLCRSDLQQSTAVQVRSSAIHSCAGQIFSNPQLCRSDLQQSTAVQVRSSVWLIPQNQPSIRDLLPSPKIWVARSVPCSHASWRLSAYFGHSHREVPEMPVLFRWALRPQCQVHRRKIVVCWTHSSL